jgi:hypothetical protein
MVTISCGGMQRCVLRPTAACSRGTNGLRQSREERARWAGRSCFSYIRKVAKVPNTDAASNLHHHVGCRGAKQIKNWATPGSKLEM